MTSTQAFTPTTFDRLHPYPGYQSLPVEEGFNWGVCLDGAVGSWYLVVFRSLPRPSADRASLTARDELAFTEAEQSGGLIRYFRGTPDSVGQCVSLCVWDRRVEAVGAANGPQHRKAISVAAKMYTWYRLERYALLAMGGRPAFRLLGVDGATGDPLP